MIINHLIGNLATSTSYCYQLTFQVTPTMNRLTRTLVFLLSLSFLLICILTETYPSPLVSFAAPSDWMFAGRAAETIPQLQLNTAPAVSTTVYLPLIQTDSNESKAIASDASTIPAPLSVVINEVAWAGTEGSGTDEWIELYNNTGELVDLDGWMITISGGKKKDGTDKEDVNLLLEGTIFPYSYYLIERTDDTAIQDVKADLTTSFGSGLSNKETDEITLFLSANGVVVDTANLDKGFWPKGKKKPDRVSMERIDPLAPDTDDNWADNTAPIRNGLDKDGNPIYGTPRQPNSAGFPQPRVVVINEVGWGGTSANSDHKWLELLNTTAFTIELDGWAITSTNGLTIALDGATVEPNAYFLIEHLNDNTIISATADLTATFPGGIFTGGDSLFLSANGTVIDTANVDGGFWPAGSAAPDVLSMERIKPAFPDTDDNWTNHDGPHHNGIDAGGNPIKGTPGQPNSTTYPKPILISEFVYDGVTPSTEGDEFVELCNPNATEVDLTGYKVGDEETKGSRESMYHLPDGAKLQPAGCLIVTKNRAAFTARFSNTLTISDSLIFEAGQLSKYKAWGSGSWSLSNSGDELLVLGPDDQRFDSVAYRNGDYAAVGLEPGASAPQPKSLQRVWPTDTGSMPHDFIHTDPTPGELTEPPPPPASPPPAAALPDGMKAYWGHLHAHTTYSDGAGPPFYALAKARAAGMHYYAITDHGWWLTENEWTRTLSQTEAATVPGAFVALRGLEWTHASAGHINIFNSDTLLSRTDPLHDDLASLYTWLANNPNVIAQFNHPDSHYGGTFTDFALHPAAAPMIFLQEIGNNAQQYTTYEAAFVQSNMAGWRAAPVINADAHQANWGSDMAARTGLVAPSLTQESLLEAIRARRAFATEDSNLALALRAGDVWMGSMLDQRGSLSLEVNLVDPDDEPATLYLFDRNLLLATKLLEAGASNWQTTVQTLPGHFYWVKAVQADGDRAYSAPIWMEGQAPVDRLVINEVLPAPYDYDWNDDGTADYQDEWIELYNPLDRPVGLGGWRLSDSSGTTYDFPLGVSIAAGGFLTVYYGDFDFVLNNSEETVTLTQPDGTVIDTFSYSHSPGYDQSWCRLPDGGSAWRDDCIGSPNGANWERQPAGPLEVKIFKAKRLAYNAWVKVSGRVTAPPGVLGKRAMYIQDDSAGILVYLPKDHRLSFNLGDKVKVEGNLRDFHGESEIVVKRRSKVKFVEPGPPVHPLPIETTNMLDPYEGMVVMLRGQAVRFHGRTTFWLDDGTDPAKIFIRNTTHIKKPFLERGTPITVVGIVSQYSKSQPGLRTDFRLLPRFQEDLIWPQSPQPTPKSWPSFLPDTGN